jgi:hypothetical protein
MPASSSTQQAHDLLVAIVRREQKASRIIVEARLLAEHPAIYEEQEVADLVGLLEKIRQQTDSADLEWTLTDGLVHALSSPVAQESAVVRSRKALMLRAHGAASSVSPALALDLSRR